MRTQRRRHFISDFRYTPLVAALGLALAPNAGAATVVVNDLSDASVYDMAGPDITLRGAIDHFNAIDPVNCSPTGGDVINFDFPNGPFTVSVASSLPVIACGGLTIDGLLPNGPNAGSHVALTTSNPDPLLNANGLESNTSVPVLARNLDISGFSYGAALSGRINSDSNLLHDNFRGLDNRGSSGTSVINTVAQANTNTGIYVSYGGAANIQDNTITGNAQGLLLQASAATVSGNVIGGNTGAGILISADQGSTISGGNHIGTTLDDSGALPNLIGIVIGDTFGATSFHTVVQGNTISANTSVGIDMADFSGVHVVNNYIGTNASGASGLGNGAEGILASCGADLEVRDNTISGNSGDGISLGGVVGTATTLSGNMIGVKAGSLAALRNNANGVVLYSIGCPIGGDVTHTSVATAGVSMPGNIIGFNGGDGIAIFGSSNNSIVGTGDPPDNKIFNNIGYGVNIASGVNNAITGYLIYGNASGLGLGAKNINLGAPGGTLGNDPGDVDAGGPNNGQNYPANVTATRNFATHQTTVAFTLDTQPGLYQIDVYSNASSTVPGGDALLGSTATPLLVSATGGTPGSVVVPSDTADNFSLLATRMQDPVTPVETSEFSSPVFTIGSVPSVSISPPGIDFGNVAVGTDSPPRTITITSNGSSPYTINTISDTSCTSELLICSSGAFTCTTTCGAGSYNPGSGCQITATFHPTAIATFPGTIAICDNAAPGSRTIALAGNGVAPPPVLILPGAWDFGTTLLGTSSPPHLFTVLNPGDVAVDIGAVTTTTSAFVLNDTNCGTTLAPQATCVADVSFVPTGTGLITGTLSIAASTPLTAFSSKSARKVASSPAATSALSGTGVVQAVLDLPSAIDFGAYTSGATPVRRVVTLRANGNAVLSLPSISATGPFVLGNDCPENMQPGDSCTLTLDFSAADLGNYTGTLVVVTNAVGGTRTIPLTARTVAIPAPLIQVSPASIGFGDRLLGSSEGSQRVTITNVGNDAAVLSPPLATTTDYLVTTTCGVTLAPSTSCFADVTFRPAGFGFRTGQLLINSNSVGSPNAIDLAGTGCRPFSSTMSRFGARFGCAP